jgi:hypothetical protein
MNKKKQIRVMEAGNFPLKKGGVPLGGVWRMIWPDTPDWSLRSEALAEAKKQKEITARKEAAAEAKEQSARKSSPKGRKKRT